MVVPSTRVELACPPRLSAKIERGMSAGTLTRCVYRFHHEGIVSKNPSGTGASRADSPQVALPVPRLVWGARPPSPYDFIVSPSCLFQLPAANAVLHFFAGNFVSMEHRQQREVHRSQFALACKIVVFARDVIGNFKKGMRFTIGKRSPNHQRQCGAFCSFGQAIKSCLNHI